MTAEYNTVKLREVLGESGYIRGPFGSALRRSELKESGIPVYEQQHAINNSRKFRFFIDKDKFKTLRRFTVRENDLIISCSGTLARVSIIRRNDPKGIISQALLILRPDTKIIDPKYLYYFMSSKRGFNALVGVSTGSVQVNIARRSIIEETELPLPPYRDQQAISCILGALDDKVDLNWQMNLTLEALARAIFKSWFMDFDPVRIKANGGQLPGIKPAVADLFPDSFRDSELGKIPEGWKTLYLPDLMAVNPTRRLAKGTIAPYLGMANMPTEGHCPESWRERDFGSGMRFMNGDTLVARITPCLENGKTAYVDFLQDNEIGWGSTEYIVLRPHDPIPKVFAYLLARSMDFRAFAIQRMTGSSGRQRVPADSLSTYQIASPAIDSKIFEAFGEAVKCYFERIHTSMKEIRILKSLRDALLHKLISGELRIPDAEKIVKRAL